MMKVSFLNTGKFTFFYMAAFLFLSTYCSRILHPEPSNEKQVNNNIENQVDNLDILNRSVKNKLEDFMKSGSEKSINIKKTSADQIIETAKKYLGVPHCMGGTTIKCMDCSGLLVTVFARHGITLPHNAEEQARYGKIITEKNDLKEGDLVFFTRSYKTNRFITHSGIYTGNNKFIHTSTGKGVVITPMDNPWWEEKFVFGTRLIE